MSAYIYADDEKPTAAGAPYMPRMSPSRRLVYTAAGTFICSCNGSRLKLAMIAFNTDSGSN